MRSLFRFLLLVALAGVACDPAEQVAETRTSGTPVVDPVLVGKWKGRARDYGLFDRVRFDIRADGRFDVWIRDEHRPFLLEASNGRWKVRSTRSDFTQSGTYDLKKDGRVVWWGMFTTAPIMERQT